MIMKKENEVIGSLLFELEETEKVDTKPEQDGTYSITVAYGSFFTLLCC